MQIVITADGTYGNPTAPIASFETFSRPPNSQISSSRKEIFEAGADMMVTSISWWARTNNPTNPTSNTPRIYSWDAAAQGGIGQPLNILGSAPSVVIPGAATGVWADLALFTQDINLSIAKGQVFCIVISNDSDTGAPVEGFRLGGTETINVAAEKGDYSATAASEPWVSDGSSNTYASISFGALVGGKPSGKGPFPSDSLNVGDTYGPVNASDYFTDARAYKASGFPPGVDTSDPLAITGIIAVEAAGNQYRPIIEASGISPPSAYMNGFRVSINALPIELTSGVPEMKTLRFDSSSPAADRTIIRGGSSFAEWSQCAISVFDAAGDEVSIATAGVVTGNSKIVGEGSFTPFATTIDLNAAGLAWGWEANLGAISEFLFSVAGLPADFTIQVTVSNF